MLSYVSDEALPALKNGLSAYHPEYRVNINSFALFAAETAKSLKNGYVPGYSASRRPNNLCQPLNAFIISPSLSIESIE